jgi:hypothetical protein
MQTAYNKGIAFAKRRQHAASAEGVMEATAGIEPAYPVLQTGA